MKQPDGQANVHEQPDEQAIMSEQPDELVSMHEQPDEQANVHEQPDEIVIMREQPDEHAFFQSRWRGCDVMDSRLCRASKRFKRSKVLKTIECIAAMHKNANSSEGCCCEICGFWSGLQKKVEGVVV